MTELSDYRRLVEQPMICAYEKQIKGLLRDLDRAREEACQGYNLGYAAGLERMSMEARFLCERLREFQNSMGSDAEEDVREFFGHVAPGIARLEAALSACDSGSLPKGQDAEERLGAEQGRAAREDGHRP